MQKREKILLALLGVTCLLIATGISVFKTQYFSGIFYVLKLFIWSAYLFWGQRQSLLSLRSIIVLRIFGILFTGPILLSPFVLSIGYGFIALSIMLQICSDISVCFFAIKLNKYSERKTSGVEFGTIGGGITPIVMCAVLSMGLQDASYVIIKYSLAIGNILQALFFFSLYRQTQIENTEIT